jgi:hypothetical protein
MPSQLLDRFRRFLNQDIARQIMNLRRRPHTDGTPHWPDGQWGREMGTIQSIVIHETSGSPSYGGKDTFVGRYSCTVDADRGFGPQYFVEPNGTIYNLVGEQEFTGSPRMTYHAGWTKERIDMNPISVGIENGDIGDAQISPGRGTGPAWWALSDRTADLGGMKAYLLLAPGPRPQHDAVLIWFAKFAKVWVLVPEQPATDTTPAVDAHWVLRDGTLPGFDGAGDIVDGTDPATQRHIRLHAWRNMLFTERNFRSLVLLTRFAAERHGVPRNFPLLPYASADPDWSNSAVFRKLILAEQRGGEIAVQMGTTREFIQANSPAFVSWYGGTPKAIWSRLFGVIPGAAAVPATPTSPARSATFSTPVVPCFRGILAHSADGAHPCPGPLFDWHRFAREVWDWWWYPYDLVPGAAGTPPTAATARRPYFRARRTTPLLEYYYDAVGTPANYAAMREPATAEDTFRLPAGTPVYALANGVIVAARLGAGAAAGTGFVLVRHELFHRTAHDRIDYDAPPTYVWTLVSRLDNAGVDIPAAPPAVAAPPPAANPSWLDRFVLRLRECELAVQFHAAHAGLAELRTGWAHPPDGVGPPSGHGRGDRERRPGLPGPRHRPHRRQRGPLPPRLRHQHHHGAGLPRRLPRHPRAHGPRPVRHPGRDLLEGPAPGPGRRPARRLRARRAVVAAGHGGAAPRDHRRRGPAGGRHGLALRDDRLRGVDQPRHLGIGAAEVRHDGRGRVGARAAHHPDRDLTRSA